MHVLLVCSMFALAVETFAAPPPDENAAAFMSQVLVTYRALSTYRDHGRSVQTLKFYPSDPSKSNTTVDFVTLFKRPNKFRYSWITTDNLMDGSDTRPEDAIWSDGDKVWALFVGDDVPEQQESFSAAVAGAEQADIYRMLSDKVRGLRFDQLHAPRIIRSETVAGVDCYVVRGSQHGGWGYDLWIGKQDHLIRKTIQTQPSGNTETTLREDIVVNEDIPDTDHRFTDLPRR